jgi:acetolactate synthase-1/2/3 large subunit
MTTPRSETTGARELVAVLRHNGVQRVYGVPGEHCLELVDEVDRQGLQLVAARHEGGAAFMAEAEAKLTGVPGVCLGTAGVGATNLAIGIHTAQQDSTPLIALVGQVSTAHRHREAWQEFDVAAAFTPIAKWSVEIGHVGRVAELTRRAVGTALVGRSGPVVLAVPDDVQRASASPSPSYDVARAVAGLAADSAVTVLDEIGAASRPVLLVGGGLAGGTARASIVRLAECTGLEVVVGFRRPDAFPHDHPAFVGASGIGAADLVREALTEADLIVALGTRLSELTTLGYTVPSVGQRFVHIDPSPEVLTAAHRQADLAYVADAEAAADALAAEAGRRPLAAVTHRQVRSGPAGDEDDLVARVAQELNLELADDAIVTSDAGDFYPPFARAVRYVGNRRYLGPTSGAMGYALPAAIAAALAAPGRQIVAVAGDGGFMMSLPELETAVRLRASLVAIVVNNNCYGSIARHQSQRYGGRLVGVGLTNPSFARLAEVFGARGRQLASAADLAHELRAAREHEGPTVLELVL